MSNVKMRAALLSALVLLPFFFLRTYAVGESTLQWECGTTAHLLGFPKPPYRELEAPFVAIRPNTSDGCVAGNLKTIATGLIPSVLTFVSLYPLAARTRRQVLLVAVGATGFGFLVPVIDGILDQDTWTSVIFRGLASTGTFLAIALTAYAVGLQVVRHFSGWRLWLRRTNQNSPRLLPGSRET